MSILSERAMLAQPTISTWSGRKLDRKVTDEVNESHGAERDAGRYNKLLLPKEAFAEVNKVASAARAEHYKRTLPWIHAGAALLPTAGYLEYAAAMRDLRQDFERAAENFVSRYPALVAQAPARLNGMFDAGDFPPVDVIRHKFNFAVAISPVPDAADFRVSIGDAQAAEIRADIERRANEALASAMRDAYQRVADVAGRMVERLRAYAPATETAGAQGVFRDSLVENVRELVALLPGLNIAGDAKLAAIAERMSRELCQHGAEELRDSDAIRSATAQAAESILADVSAYLA